MYGLRRWFFRAPLSTCAQTARRPGRTTRPKSPVILQLNPCESRDQPGNMLGVLAGVTNGGILPDPLQAVTGIVSNTSGTTDRSTGETNTQESTRFGVRGANQVMAWPLLAAESTTAKTTTTTSSGSGLGNFTGVAALPQPGLAGGLDDPFLIPVTALTTNTAPGSTTPDPVSFGSRFGPQGGGGGSPGGGESSAGGGGASSAASGGSSPASGALASSTISSLTASSGAITPVQGTQSQSGSSASQSHGVTPMDEVGGGGDGGVNVGITPPPSITVPAPLTIPVNANDDNGSPWVAGQPGIPTVRDYDITTPTAFADPQLIPVSVTVNNPAVALLWVSTYCPGEATISLWKDQQKSGEFTVGGISPANNTVTFYVEGTHQSSTTADYAYINLQYTPPGGDTITKQIQVLVTPILLSYVGTTPNPNVTFINGINGLEGIQAQNPAGAVGQVSGITLKANVQTSSCEFMNFIQNATGDTNGANGGTGDGGVWLNDGATIYDLIPNDGLNFPFLDTPQGNAPGNPYMPSVGAGNLYITADSPQLQAKNPAVSATVSTIDLGESYSTYLVVKYADNSIYPIACLDWSVNFYATTWVQNQGVTVINPASGVSIGNSSSVWGDSGLVTGGPTAVQATHWEEVT